MIYKSMNNVTEWQTEAYQYLSSSSDAVYVECIVRICLLDTDKSAECSHCSSRKRRDGDGESSDPSSEMAFIKSPVFFIIEKGIKTTKSSYF